MKNIRIETLGCRLNQIESEAAGHFFVDNGFTVLMEGVTSGSQEDQNTLIYILNTCAVTQKAEQKARRLIRLILKKYPSALLVVTGCYAQLSEKEINDMDPAIVVVGGQIKSRIAEIPYKLKIFLSENEWNREKFKSLIVREIISKNVKRSGYPEDSFKFSASSYIAHSRASLKIQDGCNNSCAYCTIHIARGHSVSIDVQTAVDRVVELEQKGFEEVVLTSVNIAQYAGKYEDEYYNFPKLLKKMLEATSTINFRISSIYPEVVSEEFCQIISHNRVRPHFHISVQNGSNDVLRNMNRHYDAEAVVEVCRKLRQVKNNPFIACDIITGFPGETDSDFRQTMELCNKCNFIWIHAFPFSERPGTPAVKMKNKVPQNISGERAKRLNDFAVSSKINYINSYIGKELPCIIETSRHLKKDKETNEYIYHCVTENFLHCEIHTDKLLKETKNMKVKIIKPLSEGIIKGGELEALAEIL